MNVAPGRQTDSRENGPRQYGERLSRRRSLPLSPWPDLRWTRWGKFPPCKLHSCLLCCLSFRNSVVDGVAVRWEGHIFINVTSASMQVAVDGWKALIGQSLHGRAFSIWQRGWWRHSVQFVLCLYLQGWNKRVDYEPGTGSRQLFPKMHLETCGGLLSGVKAMVELQTNHIGKGCDRETYSEKSLQKLCGKEGDGEGKKTSQLRTQQGKDGGKCFVGKSAVQFWEWRLVEQQRVGILMRQGKI